MKVAKVRVYIALFAYSGNGGVASTIPELAVWLAKTYHEMKTDERIDGVAIKIYCDTPIPMTRCRAVRDAQQHECDMVLMLDSDNEPDGYMSCGGDAKPFWKTAFDFAYDRLTKQDMPTVIAAPYCGPPPPPVEQQYIVTNGDVTYAELYGGEVPYLFQWSNRESDNPHTNLKIDILTRNEASLLSGIHPVAALPTGVCLFTLNAFKGLVPPYFKYEMNADGSEKESTEDVVATRDISLFWKMTKGYDVLFATCDSWALHHKTKKVGRPQFVPVDSVAETLLEAVKLNRQSNESLAHVDFERGQTAHRLTNKFEILGPDVDHVIISEADMDRARILAEREAAPVVEDQAEDDTDVDEASDLDEVFYEPVPATPVPTNGKQPALEYTMVRGRKVAVFNDFRVSEDDLEGVDAITSWLVSRKGGALEVVVLNSGTGQSTAVINSVLPEGSHIYALDCFTPHQYSTVPAEQFNLSFAPEIERGRIQPDNLDRKMPEPNGKQHLDMVFSEQFATAEKLERWYEHVQPGGLIAGLGYSKKAKPVVNKFIKQHKLQLKTQGDVWAIPVPATKEIVPANIEQPVVDEDDERVDLYVESYDGERF